jgi:hypothetical protein
MVPAMRHLALLSVLLVGCGTPYPDIEPTPEPVVVRVDPDELCATEDLFRCDGAQLERCDGEGWIDAELCAGTTPVCDAPAARCTSCTPGARVCVGDQVGLCEDDGTLSVVDTCETTEQCLAGACRDRCEVAANRRSYLGCSFTAVATANIVDPIFDGDFAVVVGNPSDTDEAVIQVTRDGVVIADQTLAPRTTAAISLPIVPELKPHTATVIVPGGAYKVTSSLPIAAYQFNPLNFIVFDGMDDQYSYTNDASLLLPDHALDGEYLVTTYPTWGIATAEEVDWIPGFVAISPLADGTTVTVDSRAFTLGGDVPAGVPGVPIVVTLDAGDVLQLFSRRVPQLPSPTPQICGDLGGTYSELQTQQGPVPICLDGPLGDLTGTSISADGDVAVFAGHPCTFVPFDEAACDHLEEMMLPRATWGTEVAMVAPTSPSLTGVAESIYRVLSGADGNVLTFSPAVHGDVTLDEREFVEFAAAEDFVIRGTQRFLATQALSSRDAVISVEGGDPAFGTGIPTSQWRDRYDFLAPDSYSTNHIGLIAPRGTRVYLDGVELVAWFPVPGEDLVASRVEIEGGSHRIQSLDGVGFGITMYGYARYTSYLMPGGLNLLR